MATSIEDRNGNELTLTANPNVAGAFTVEDTLGRTVLSSSGFGTTGNTVTVAGLSSAYTVTWGTATVKFSVTSTGSSDSGECSPLPAASASFPVITAIELPNGQKYQFSYDPNYGSVSKIVYPSGGYVSYTWGLNSQSALITFPVSSGTGTCSYIYDKPAILHRYVSFDGSTTALQQDFSFSTVWNSEASAWTSKQTTVTTHDLVRGTEFETIHSYAGASAPEPPFDDLLGQNEDAEMPQETQTVYQDVGGAVLKTVTKTWFDLFVISSETTALGSGTSAPTSEVTYTYGPGDQVTQKEEYDFGSGAPGSLLRKTVTNYQTFGVTPIFPAAASIFDKPCQTIVYDSTGTNRVAETDYLYDGGTSVCGTAGTPSVTPVSGLPTGTHDETNYPATSSAPRANLTTVTNLCIQAAPACTSGNPATTYTYDETGQVLTMKDPKSNTTQYSYADSYTSGTPPGSTNAYVTQITRPATNGVNHISNYSYGYADGKLTVAKDENGQSTTYAYSTDPLDRLTQATYPTNGGETLYTYNDTAPTPSITTQKELTSGTFLKTINLMDGVRHPVQGQLTSDPTGTDYTVTKYDGLGRKYTVTNPYRTTSDPTYGVTTYTYDAIGRTTQVAEADGSKVATSYSGNCSTVTDEASKTRESCTDGAGRMTEVIENPGGLSYTTNYTYDALNDLLTVVQGSSHNRSFVYDSLKRLTSSTNPEAGTVTYTYDANSNVSTKLDARSITITYAYDALNRMTGKTYSNSDPSVTYTYDQSACLGQSACYNIGRRTSMTDAAGSESWAYDTMGRELAEQRTTNSITKSAAYSYTLGGSLATLTYPSGRTVTYTYDAAAQPLSAVDTANSINYATSALYSPPGGLSSVANGASLISTLYYNTRLQPCRISVKSSGTAPTSCTDTTDIGNVLDYTYNFSLGASDNGNVIGITNNIDNTRSQSFTYDQVNRIITAQTPSSCGSNCWSQSFTYDQWANLTAAAATGTAPALSLSVNANNRITTSGFNYDAAGNETSDVTSSYVWNAESQTKTAGGVNYTYDGDGDRVEKSNGALYWYGAGSQVLMETNLSGSLTSEYVYFGAKRVARRDASNDIYYYAEDMLGSSRAITTATGTVCYNADFYPYGGEHAITNTCPQNYKFESKERDAETTNDDFGARYYSSAYGRFISADWSAVPAPVPYANLTNPQTLNLYAMVRDNPETFADLDGHILASWFYAAAGTNEFPLTKDDPAINDADFIPEEYQSPQPPANLAWSNLSSGQQALVQGGEQAWNALSSSQGANFAAITQALQATTLSDGTSGLSQITSVKSIGNQSIEVAWKEGAQALFQSSGFVSRWGLGHDGESGMIGKRTGNGIKGSFFQAEGMHVLFKNADKGATGDVHIDYRSGPAHFRDGNSDVRATGPSNYNTYKSWYGPIPGYNP
jgi:RHS repeat-associated protein